MGVDVWGLLVSFSVRRQELPKIARTLMVEVDYKIVSSRMGICQVAGLADFATELPSTTKCMFVWEKL